MSVKLPPFKATTDAGAEALVTMVCTVFAKSATSEGDKLYPATFPPSGKTSVIVLPTYEPIKFPASAPAKDVAKLIAIVFKLPPLAAEIAAAATGYGTPVAVKAIVSIVGKGFAKIDLPTFTTSVIAVDAKLTIPEPILENVSTMSSQKLITTPTSNDYC